jgi:predicted nuclease of predicted toxin-antitoxin system
MKIKLDENLPFRLVGILSGLGHEIDTIPQEGLKGCNDEQVWEAAQRSGRFLITQDLNFSNINLFKPGTHYGLLLIRLRNPGRNALLNRVQTIFRSEEIERWQGCFVVVTDHKIRIRYPK